MGAEICIRCKEWQGRIDGQSWECRCFLPHSSLWPRHRRPLIAQSNGARPRNYEIDEYDPLDAVS